MSALDDRLHAARSRLNSVLEANPPDSATVVRKSRRRRGVAGLGITLVLTASVAGIWSLQADDGGETTVLAGDRAETDTAVDEPSLAPPSTTTAEPDTEAQEVPFALGGGWGARTSPDGRSVLITFTGAAPLVNGDDCTADYRAESIAESPEEVSFGLTQIQPRVTKPSNFTCLAIGYARSVVLRLADPLGGRRLVEASSGNDLPVFDGSQLLTPAWLPDGWELLMEGPAYALPETGRDWRRSWGDPVPDEGGYVSCPPGRTEVELAQVPEGALPTYFSKGLEPVATYEIGGSEAIYSASPVEDPLQRRLLTWTQNGWEMFLSTTPTCAGEQPVDLEILLQIARSVA